MAHRDDTPSTRSQATDRDGLAIRLSLQDKKLRGPPKLVLTAMLIEYAWNLHRHVPSLPLQSGPTWRCLLSPPELSHPENLFGVVSVLGDIHHRAKGPPFTKRIQFKELLSDTRVRDLCCN
ncbi:hypothetical protein TNCT_718721 [Trichonephila clavata]|uniref:Uncharacterized protein n=1 Tax=Trichonephila clavata TaxID=2740835 RepID=A0A8X6JCH7_TRICU|nr:hypothetical protein TNCT_718721 [Trichonephila clavata]